MSEFQMKCPHCGDELNVQSEWTGMDVACPSCKKTFKVVPSATSNREIKKYLAQCDRQNKKNLDQVNSLGKMCGIGILLTILACILPSPLSSICWVVVGILFLVYIGACYFS